MNDIIEKTRVVFCFKAQWTWRLFLALQLMGIIGLVFLSITARSWRFFPYAWQRELTWDFFDSSYWTYQHYNWWALLAVAGPYIIGKLVDWIAEAKQK